MFSFLSDTIIQFDSDFFILHIMCVNHFLYKRILILKIFILNELFYDNFIDFGQGGIRTPGTMVRSHML